MGNEQSARNVGVFHSQKGRSKTYSRRCFAGEILKQVRGNADMGCGSQMMRRGYLAMRDGSWKSSKERYREEEEKSSEWTLERTREAYEKVAKDEIGRLGIVQETLRRSTEFLRRVIAPVGGMECVTLSYICPHCNSFSLEDYIWWVSTGHGDSRKKNHCSWWCAVCGGKYEWRASNRILVVQVGTNANEAKVFRAHAAPQGSCEKNDKRAQAVN